MKPNLYQAVHAAVIAFNARVKPLVELAHKPPAKKPLVTSKPFKQPPAP